MSNNKGDYAQQQKPTEWQYQLWINHRRPISAATPKLITQTALQRITVPSTKTNEQTQRHSMPPNQQYADPHLLHD
jgi:hypothetical protein